MDCKNWNVCDLGWNELLLALLMLIFYLLPLYITILVMN